MVWGKKRDEPIYGKPASPMAPADFARFLMQQGMTPPVAAQYVQRVFGYTGPADETRVPKPEPIHGDRPLIAGLQGWRSLMLNVRSLGTSMLPIISLEGSRGGAIDAEWSELAKCGVGHGAPYFGCTCGYYIVNEPTGATEWAEGIYAVRAKVTASGKVVRCETGFKAQQYRIDEMYVRPALRPLVPLLEEQFSCNVFIGYPEVKE